MNPHYHTSLNSISTLITAITTQEKLLKICSIQVPAKVVILYFLMLLNILIPKNLQLFVIVYFWLSFPLEILDTLVFHTCYRNLLRDSYWVSHLRLTSLKMSKSYKEYYGKLVWKDSDQVWKVTSFMLRSQHHYCIFSSF